MTSSDVFVFQPGLDSGPKEFYILSENDSLEDYQWALEQFDPDLTYIVYPFSLFQPYFRDLTLCKKAHSPDNCGLNSALYVLTQNEGGMGFIKTLSRRLYAYLTEAEALLNGCGIDELYFNLSSQVLSTTTKSSPHRVLWSGSSSSSRIDPDGLFIRGAAPYVMNMLFDDESVDFYNSHFEEHAVMDGESVPKHEYFLMLYQSVLRSESNDLNAFWKYLVKWREMIYWDYFNDPESYLPHPAFTKLLRRSYDLYPWNGSLRHLPFDTSFKCLVRDTFMSLQEEGEDAERVLLIVPNEEYGEHFMRYYGETADSDLKYGAPYREMQWIHPRGRPIVGAMFGFGMGYWFKKLQIKNQDVVWKRRVYRLGRWTANGATLCGLGIYGMAAWYFSMLSSVAHVNQTRSKHIDRAVDAMLNE